MNRIINILLVEDNPTDILFTQEAFRDGKFANNLVIARDGIECMDFLKGERGEFAGEYPDLILLDLNMPRMDGREVLESCKSDKALAPIPIVILTTSKAEGDIQMTYLNHVNCYIVKPVNFDALATVVMAIGHFWFTIVTLPSEGEDYDG